MINRNKYSQGKVEFGVSCDGDMGEFDVYG